jgi:low affinity Fe/Cu permease
MCVWAGEIELGHLDLPCIRREHYRTLSHRRLARAAADDEPSLRSIVRLVCHLHYQGPRIVQKGAVNGWPPVNRLFSDIAQITSREVGRAWVFVLAVVTIIVWAITGPVFGFSDTWQLVINTGTTIVTFLMVFLIQDSQNRDAAAIQVKLTELIRVSKVHNSFVGLERLTDDEIEEIRAKCEARAKAGLARSLNRSSRLSA